jgi:hypothetical protein
MCDDVHGTLAQLAAKGVTGGPIHEERWGLATTLKLPGGEELGLYQPSHPTAIG